MASQVVHCIVPWDTIHIVYCVRGTPWSCVVHSCIGWPWVTILCVSAALYSVIETVNLVGYFFVVLYFMMSSQWV